MRTLTDNAGRRWSVDVMFGSYGTHVLIFALQGGSEVRKTALGADSQIEAAQTLDALSDESLAEELAASVPLDEESPFGI